MTKVTFEVGKEYRNNETKRTIKVLWVGDEKMVVTYTVLPDPTSFVRVGQELLWDMKSCVNWHEYHEPIIEKKVATIIGGRSWKEGWGIIKDSEVAARYYKSQIVGKLEITFTDDIPTDARIIK